MKHVVKALRALADLCEKFVAKKSEKCRRCGHEEYMHSDRGPCYQSDCECDVFRS